jgi:hypothetical protein
MSQTIAAGLGLAASIFCVISSFILIDNVANRSILQIRAHYRQESDAHRCGRALAAIANINAEAQAMSELGELNSNDLTTASVFLTRKIEESVREQASISEDRCRINSHSGRGAILHRYNRFHSKKSFANYTYKLDFSNVGD